MDYFSGLKESDMPVSGITKGASSEVHTDTRQKTDPAGFSKVLNEAIPHMKNSRPQNSGPATLIELGKISKETPTVSHILINHPEYSGKCWDIIFSSKNQGKQFTKMREGTIVALKPGSNELVWGKDLSITADNVNAGSSGDAINIAPEKSDTATAKITIPEQNADAEQTHQGSLADAVKQFIGTPYNEIDCYGLVIRGLMNQGVQYRGQGGLREKLETLAVRDGLPYNTYFSGEGLVEKAGIKVYSKSIPNISNAQKKADEIYSEMAPYLREGLVLSFSTPTRGHTGVVSRQGDHWTYINSGVIDHEISSGRISKRVGEEYLKAEIKNWCVLAAGKNEPLMVTIGHVNRNMLQGSSGHKETI